VAVVGLCLSALAATSEATTLRVTVVKNGEQVPRETITGARVCYATLDNPSRRDVAVTNGNGIAEFQNVPSGPLKLAIVKVNFGSRVVDIDMGSIDKNVEFALFEGQGDSSIACTLPPQYTTLPDLKILSFQLNGGAQSTKDPLVSIGVRLDRNPKFYRISETAESINSAPWILFVQGEPVLYNLGITGINNFGTRYLYFQAKPGDSGASASRVASASIVLEPAKLKTYTVTGAELKELLRRAKEEWGYTFSSRTIFSTTDRCNNSGDELNLDIPIIIIYATFEKGTWEKGYDSTFFIGKKLNRFWRIVSIGVEASPGSDVGREGFISSFPPPGLSSEDPKHIVRIKFVTNGNSHAPCIENKFLFKSIKLEGPDGFDWRDAFRR
jgi:hypothetical protein